MKEDTISLTVGLLKKCCEVIQTVFIRIREFIEPREV